MLLSHCQIFKRWNLLVTTSFPWCRCFEPCQVSKLTLTGPPYTQEDTFIPRVFVPLDLQSGNKWPWKFWKLWKVSWDVHRRGKIAFSNARAQMTSLFIYLKEWNNLLICKPCLVPQKSWRWHCQGNPGLEGSAHHSSTDDPEQTG